jgi:sigma-E factor negative regulatory protein RseB
MRRRLPLLVVAMLSPLCALADDGMALLQRVAASLRQQTYTGTFVYRCGSQEETSRIAHALTAGREMERIEVLDGSPREIVRTDGETRYFLPEENLLIVESRASASTKSFPNLLPPGLAGLVDHYHIRLGAQERVAGLQSRAVRLEPKDNLRYGHEFWMDASSGLLLKAATRGPSGEMLESFTFTQIKVGGPLEPGALTPGYAPDRVRVQQPRAIEAKNENLGWTFRDMLPGFRRVTALKRWSSADTRKAPDSLHLVFSDGLAAVSVFIEPEAKADEPEGLSSMGAINVYRRQLAGHRLLVMGEVPASAVKRLGDGIVRAAP